MSERPIRPTDDNLRRRRWPLGGGEPIDTATVAAEAIALRYIGDAIAYLAEMIGSSSESPTTDEGQVTP